MNTKTIFLLGVLGTASGTFAQHPVVQIDYEVEKSTTFYVDDEHVDELSDYDKIAFMPTAVNEVHSETIFDNGDVRVETNLAYPFGSVEDWQTLPSKMIIHQDVREIYVDDTLFASYAIPSETETIPAEEFAPLYLGTAQWQLPMPDEAVQDYLDEGWTISINNEEVLYYYNSTESFLYNAAEMVEQHTLFDEQTGKALSTETIGYTVDENGYFVYDFKLERYLKTHREPCYEKVVFTNYKNIHKDYLEPAFAPSPENGYVYEQNTDESYPQISAQQIGTSHAIEVFFDEEVPHEIVVDVKDLYGHVVIPDLHLSRENNVFSAESIGTGVYNITVTSDLIQSTKFTYIQ